MKTLLLILSLLLITSNAYAEWTSYGASVTDAVYFYDKSTIKRNGDKVKVWEYINYSPDDKKAKSINVSSQRTLSEIDCVNETYKGLSMQNFTEQDLKGDMIDVPPNRTPTYIPPDVTYAVLMKLVCKK